MVSYSYVISILNIIIIVSVFIVVVVVQVIQCGVGHFVDVVFSGTHEARSRRRSKRKRVGDEDYDETTELLTVNDA
jgi:hypothetical protein